MNLLPNGRDPHLGEIENDFKDPEDEFWEKNNSVSQEIPVLKYPSDRQLYFWHLVYSDRLFELSNPTWRAAHVTLQGSKCKCNCFATFSLRSKSSTLVCIFGDFCLRLGIKATSDLLSRQVCSYMKTNGLFQHQIGTAQ